jgi:hypothetical protein
VQPLLVWISHKHYIYQACVCNHTYPECNKHAPYCNLRHDRFYSIFPHYLINDMIFEKRNLLNMKCDLVSYTNLSEKFPIVTGIDLAGGEGPSSPNTPRPYIQALCVPIIVISSLIHL